MLHHISPSQVGETLWWIDDSSRLRLSCDGTCRFPFLIATVLINCQSLKLLLCASEHLTHSRHVPVSHTNTVFQFQPIEEEDVLLALERLNTCKATGPDGVSAHLLRTEAAAIFSSITKLFNECIVSGQTPAKWKEANVTPVSKSPSAKLPTDFRPISVVPMIPRCTSLYKQLYTYLTTNSLLHPKQSGFRPSHSTQDALLKTMDDWRIALHLGKSVGAVSLDLSKVFGSINHSLLLKKLQTYGVEGNEHRWFSNYLNGRKQRVKLEDCCSEWANVLRGVPQGSIFGPLLFLLYENDLPDVVTKCTMNMYADDVAIYFASKDVNEVADSLNEDLAHIATWIDTNRLKMNIGKTQLMTLGGHSFKSKWQQVDVQLQGTTIPETESVRYLGLTIDQDLSWKTHVSNVRKKAFAAIGCIRRASRYLPVKIRKMLYNSLVLPHLDYCSTVWHSCNQTLSQSVEHSQNYAMRVILNQPPRMRSASLRDQLHWTTLRQRRHNQTLCQVHRCLLRQAPVYLTSKFVRNSYLYSST